MIACRARPALVAALLILLQAAGSVSATDESAPRFRLLSADRPEQLQRRLLAASAEGYRLMASAQGYSVTGAPRIATLLERMPAGAAAPEYTVLACSGNLNEDGTGGRVNELGAEGYRLLPHGVVVRRVTDFYLPESAYEEQMVLILERSASPGSYAYDSLAFGNFDPFHRGLSERQADGYEVLGLWNSGRRLQVILEKQLAPASSAGSEEADGEYRLLFLATRSVTKTHLKRAAKRGYRVVTAEDPATVGPPLLLVRKNTAAVDPLTYRFLDDIATKLRKDKLDRKLNKKTKKGWRVTASGITENALTLERVSREPAEASYLTLSSNEPPGLPRALEDATEQGYRFLALFVEPEETTVLLEKPAPGVTVN